MGKLYRQGDVLIEEVAHLPTDAVGQDSPTKIILAQSEITGHSHVIASSDAQAFQAQGMIYIEILSHTELQHEEHAPVKLAPGYYRVRRQREYLPEGPRVVGD